MADAVAEGDGLGGFAGLLKSDYPKEGAEDLGLGRTGFLVTSLVHAESMLVFIYATHGFDLGLGLEVCVRLGYLPYDFFSKGCCDVFVLGNGGKEERGRREAEYKWMLRILFNILLK